MTGRRVPRGVGRGAEGGDRYGGAGAGTGAAQTRAQAREPGVAVPSNSGRHIGSAFIVRSYEGLAQRRLCWRQLSRRGGRAILLRLQAILPLQQLRCLQRGLASAS